MAGRRSEIVLWISSPLTQRGMAEILEEANYPVRCVSDTGLRLISNPTAIVLRAARGEDLVGGIQDLISRSPKVRLVVFSLDPTDRAELLRLGVRAVVGPDCPEAVLVSVVTLVDNGYVVAPGDEIPSIVAGVSGSLPSIELPAEERWVLDRLAAGETVSSIARKVGRSRRSMHRWLKSNLYKALGTDNRSAALVVAAHEGLVGSRQDRVLQNHGKITNRH